MKLINVVSEKFYNPKNVTAKNNLEETEYLLTSVDGYVSLDVKQNGKIYTFKTGWGFFNMRYQKTAVHHSENVLVHIFEHDLEDGSVVNPKLYVDLSYLQEQIDDYENQTDDPEMGDEFTDIIDDSEYTEFDEAHKEFKEEVLYKLLMNPDSETVLVDSELLVRFISARKEECTPLTRSTLIKLLDLH